MLNQKLYHFTKLTVLEVGTVLNPGTNNEFGSGVYFSTNMCAEYAHITKNNNAICIVIDNNSAFYNVHNRPYVHSNGHSIKINSFEVKRIDVAKMADSIVKSTLIAKGAKQLVMIAVTDYVLISNTVLA
jgi:hypothetical protein